MAIDEKDTLLGQGPEDKGAAIKGTKTGTSKAKGFNEGTGRTLAISLTQGGVSQLIEALEKVKDNLRGGKLSIHYGNKTSSQGREFVSSFMFVGEIGEPISPGQDKPKMAAVPPNVPTEL